MQALGRRFLLCIPVVMLVSPVHGAHETAFEIAQPIDLVGGVVIRLVTVVKNVGQIPAGMTVPYTTEANCIVTDGTQSGNRNAADLLGVRATVDPYHASGGGSLYGDTLRVCIDLRAAQDSHTPHGWSLDAVVHATLECVLYNAERCRRAYGPDGPFDAKYVDVQILGAERYSDLAQVYAFKDLGKLPRRSTFDD
jgi:hypothetical protein